MDLVDTTDADDEGELRLLRHEEISGLLGFANGLDLSSLLLTVLVDVLLRPLEDLDALRLGGLNQIKLSMEMVRPYN